MSVATLLLELALMGAGAYGVRVRGHWLFGLALVAGIVGSAISVGQLVVTRGIWWLAPWDLVLAPATIATAVLASPALSLRVARLRNPPRSAEASFDRALYATMHELGDIVRTAPDRRNQAALASWISEANRRGMTLVHDLERMEAPNPEWNDLVKGYLSLTQKTVAAISPGLTLEERRTLEAEGDDLLRQYEHLRRAASRRAW